MDALDPEREGRPPLLRAACRRSQSRTAADLEDAQEATALSRGAVCQHWQYALLRKACKSHLIPRDSNPVSQKAM